MLANKLGRITPLQNRYVPNLASRSFHKHVPDIKRDVALAISLIEAPSLFEPESLGGTPPPGHPPVGATCHRELLVYLPGSDGTGLAIASQLPYLEAAGYEVLCMYFPPEERPIWEDLTTELIPLLSRALAEHRRKRPTSYEKITLLGESLGGCLALRIGLEAPHLLERLIVVNPATSFNRSLGGLSSLVASTGLLSLFPQDLYIVAQAVLYPLLVDRDRMDPRARALVRALMDMSLMPIQPDSPATSPEAILSAEVRPPRVVQAGRSGGVSPGQPLSPLNAGPSTFVASGSAQWRFRMLQVGDLPEEAYRRIKVPTLFVASARDRLLPSTEECARLQALVPGAKKIILPESSHTPLMESGVDLVEIMVTAGIIRAPPCDTGATREEVDNAVASPSSPSSLPSGIPQEGFISAAGGARRVLAALEGAEEVGAGMGVVAPTVYTLSEEAAVEGVGGGVRVSTPMESPDLVRETMVWAAMDVSVHAPRDPPSAAAAPTPAPTTATVPPPAPTPTPTPLIGLDQPDLVVPAATSAAVAVAAPPPAAAAQGNGLGGKKGGEGGNGDVKAKARLAARNGAARRRSLKEGEEEPPHMDDRRWETAGRLMSPWKALTSPVLLGTENLPRAAARNPTRSGLERPVLFVGNHTLFGFYDTPVLMHELYLRGLRVRGLAHPGHWRGPLGEVMESFGAVKATPRAAYKLLSQGEAVLLFPGGSKEVCKRKGQQYQLLWKDGPDFVRLAARCGALIVPFSTLGADEAYSLAVDADEILKSPLGPVVRGAYERFAPDLDPEETVYPLTWLPGPLPVPSIVPVPASIERIYISFRAPIDPAEILGGPDGPGMSDTGRVAALYETVRSSVVQGLDELRAYRDRDPGRSLSGRLAVGLGSLLPDFGLLQRRG